MIEWLEKNRGVAIILTSLIAIEIFYFSSIRGVAGSEKIIGVATIYHLIVFFLFAFFLFVTLKGTNEVRMTHILTVLFVSVLYGFFDEFHQMFVPLRDASLKDVLTDSVGVFSAVLIYLYFSAKKIKPEDN